MKGGMSSQQQPTRKLQGQRPAPLKIYRDSHTLRKPQLPLAAMKPYRPPVVIYVHSPEVIHTEAREFMALVQRLTGRVNAHGESSIPSSATSNSFQSQTCHALPNSHTSIPGNLNGGGPDFSADSNPNSDQPKNVRSQYSTVQSLLSPATQSASISPLSPNFFFPSPRLLSPNIFREFPLHTPGQPDILYMNSPKYMLCMQSDPIVTPPVRPAMNAVPASLPSTDCDLLNNHLDYSSNVWHHDAAAV